MLFANALKDYMDHINNLSIILNDNFTIVVFFKSFFIYFANSIKLVFIYLISFKWITDFVELPAIFKHNYVAILEGKNLFEVSLETELDKSFFLFLENSALNSKNFATGFLNSFFLVLPFSVPQILAIRAFLINGLPAGIWAAMGTILGQSAFFGCVLFGLEFIIVPFLNFEPLTIILGLALLVNVLYQMTHTPNMAILNFSQKESLFKLFGLNFILAWTEQTCVFSYFGNLTINGSPNLIQTDDLNENFFVINFIYLIGILFGSIAWTGLFGFLIMAFRNFISNTFIPTMPFVILNERIHYAIVLTTTILCFSTIPYYGFDYLISNPLGFISEDKTFQTFQPKVHYHEEESSLVPFDAIGNPLPFDKVDVASNSKSALKYEHYSVDSETFWKNKRNLKPSMSESTTRKQIESSNKTNQFKKELLTIPKYDTNNLELYQPTRTTKEINIDTLLTSLFRNDVYLEAKDSKSHALLKPTRAHRQFREKYYANPVYKALVNLDMRPFLAGQPKSYNLTTTDEYDLFKRRIILQSYLNSIQDYKKVVKKDTESYAEKVYNQQFKGSLSIIRHFNFVNLNFNNNDHKKVLKFDQPRYMEFPNEVKSMLHEELDFLKQTPETIDPLDQEETYMTLNNATPLYIGWDGSLRKFLIKTACLPDQFNSGDETFQKATDTNLPEYFSFQTWSPAVEKTKFNFKQTNLKLPALPNLPDDSVTRKKLAGFGIDDGSSQSSKSSKKIVTQVTTESFLNRLPTYNWRWQWRKNAVDSDKLLDLGNAIPPRLDGITWPGINDKLLVQKLIQS